ncbi:Tripartite ATP-independent transporter, DctQ component [Rhodovulum sp. ES.010]|uniref:TRAP transporter small permease subunit n=1 Tax=Rhodovulum sp. ES.010 TaxID=1882821 RepID=UPI00092BCA43|nr:TRAP transporter small permease subunit [Rhodovulum sp. ES.010]SIO54241.1 Tripartite ATP-independent transporter, DctQ component [Rhodovulum sp. ES.010]
MMEAAFAGRSGPAALVAGLVTGWALLGGLVLLAVVAMNVASVIGGVAWKPFPGDFEMTQVGVAVAAFAFLPWCQITRANVSADIFTMGASPRWIARLRLVASAVALLFAALLVWRMSEGMADQRQYGYTTTILQFPVWLAFLPILVSLVLLVLASAVTLAEDARAARGPADG